MDILKLISTKDTLEFSQNFNIVRNYLGDRLFPDIKTPNMQAEFYRLSDPLQIPKMALVHALDTEARIGKRPTIERVQLEKMLIKEKINQTEKIRMYRDRGVTNESAIIDYVFNDMGRLSENVKTRTEVMKMELLQSGAVTVTENNLNMTVDYQVPTENKVTLDWSADDADILGDIQNLLDLGKDKGQLLTNIVTSNKILNVIRKNKGVQIAINGTAGVGTFISNAQISALLAASFNFNGIDINDERYSYEQANGTIATKRYIDENKLIIYASQPNNSIGTGLWGTTPEEGELGPWTESSVRQFITSIMWKTPDPVAVWTKSSGMFIPVLPNPQGHIIATITLTSNQGGRSAIVRTLNGAPFDIDSATASELLQYASEKGYTEIAGLAPQTGADKIRTMILEKENQG